MILRSWCTLDVTQDFLPADAALRKCRTFMLFTSLNNSHLFISLTIESPTATAPFWFLWTLSFVFYWKLKIILSWNFLPLVVFFILGYFHWFLWKDNFTSWIINRFILQPAFTCSKPAKETPEQCVKSVQI